MKNLLFLFLCLSANFACTQKLKIKTQAKLPTGQAGNTLEKPADNFPGDWMGKWQGTLKIYKDTGLVQILPMQLHVLPIENSDNYTWKIIYGEDLEKGARNYELQTIDATKGQYLVDEKNSIKLESYFFNNKFVSWYVVAESLIYVAYEKRGEALHFEVVAGKQEAVSVTGNTRQDGEDIPGVMTYPIGTLQQAVLKKQ